MALFMIASLVMRAAKGGKVGVPVNMSSVIERLAEKNRVEVQRLPHAPRYIMEASRQKGMSFCRRWYRRIYLPEFQACFDAMFAIVKIVELLARNQSHAQCFGRRYPTFETMHQKVRALGTQGAGDAACDRGRAEAAERAGGRRQSVYERQLGADAPDPDEATFHVWAESGDKTQPAPCSKNIHRNSTVAKLAKKTI